MSDKKHIHMLSELYAHPIAHNIEWRELIPGLASIGIAYSDKNGSQHFTRNDHTVVLGHAKHDTLNADEILKLRHFMSKSAAPKNEASDLAQDMVVAIDYHKATVFHAPGTVSQTRTEKHAEEAAYRELHKHPTSPTFNNTGPEIGNSYYDAIVKEMSKARRIVILGHGTGTSNAAFQFVAKIFDKNPEIAHRIAAIQQCDLEAMSESQMTSLGKELLNTQKI